MDWTFGLMCAITAFVAGGTFGGIALSEFARRRNVVTTPRELDDLREEVAQLREDRIDRDY